MKRFIYTNLLLGLILLTSYLGSDETFPSSIEADKGVASSPGVLATISPSPSLAPTPPTTPSPKPSPKPISTPSSSVSPVIGGDLNGAVNKFRKENGKSPLSTDNAICSWASQRISEIKQDFSHDGFKNPLEKLGVNGAAENIAMTSKGASYVTGEMWAKSSGHLENMLGDYTKGCGVYNGKYAVYIFARN